MPSYSIICGFKAYRQQVVTAHLTVSDDEGEIQRADHTWKATYDYEFNTTPGSYSAGWVEKTEGSRSLLDNWSLIPNLQTASSATLGDPYNSENYLPHVWANEDYYTPSTMSYITNKLDVWTAQSEPFRKATGSTGSDFVFQSESSDYRSAASRGHYAFRADSEFTSSLDDIWNGNFYVNFRITTRPLSPTIYITGYYEDSVETCVRGLLASGLAIYNKGFSQEVLSNPIPDDIKYHDVYGVFGDNSPNLLNDAPKVSRYDPLNGIASHTAQGDGAGHELTWVSRFGNHLQLTFEKMHRIDGEEPTAFGTVVVDTPPPNFRATHTLPDLPEADPTLVEWYYYRLAKIKRLRVGGNSQAEDIWDTIADDSEDLPVAEEMVTSSPELDPRAVLLFYAKERVGIEWGWVERKAPFKTRYQTNTFTKSMTIEAESTDGGCGSGLSGSFDLEYVQDHSGTTGLPLAPTVTNLQMSVNNIDWASAEHQWLLGHIGGEVETDTATTLKLVRADSWPKNSYEVKMDARDGLRYGKILSEKWVTLPVAKEVVNDDEIYNVIDWTKLPAPESGQAVIVDGYRLTERTEE